MPTNGIDLYQMQDARNNFDAMRPAPICSDANQFMGQCQQNIHISTNCYYGYHDQKVGNSHEVTDCEMTEVNDACRPEASASPQSNARKRSADEADCPMTKRFREGIETATKHWRLPTVTLEAQCDEVRLYFRGHGAIDFQLQPMFTSSNPQQSRYISLSHGPYDLVSLQSNYDFNHDRKSNSAMSILSTEVQKEKNIEPETTERLTMDSRTEDLTETLYWNTHGGNIFHLIQCL